MRPKFCPVLSAYLGALLFILATAFTAEPSTTPETAAAEIEMQDSAFRSVPVTLIDNATELKADFTASSGWLDFTSTSRSTGEIALSATVSTDGLVTWLEAVVSADHKSVTWTGNGGTLTKESRDAVRRLLVELESLMSKRTLLPHEDWAFRLANLWSEAPLHLPLKKRTVHFPDPVKSVAPSVESEAVVAPRESMRIEELEKLNAELKTCAKGCNVSGGDKISYLRGSGKDSACSLGYYATKHDACIITTGKGHCYNSYTVQGGCSRSKKCVGRCGAGCGTFIVGNGPYTTDCLEHDHCVSHDNASPWGSVDKECGDEFFEAEDDFLFGLYNCSGCK